MTIKLDGLSAQAVLDDKKINNGVWIHLESAATSTETGQTSPLFLSDDPTKPQRALVRSYRCKALKDLEASRQKTGFVKIRVAKKKDRDEVIADNAIIPEAERFAYFLVALDNFGADGGIQYVEVEDAKTIHGMSSMDNIVQQVREAAYDDDLYLATAATEAGNELPSPKTATTAAPKSVEAAASAAE